MDSPFDPTCVPVRVTINKLSNKRYLLHVGSLLSLLIVTLTGTSFSGFQYIYWKNFLDKLFVKLKEPKTSIALVNFFLRFYISSLFANVYHATGVIYSKINNTNYSTLRCCCNCFSSHFVVPRYHCRWGCWTTTYLLTIRKIARSPILYSLTVWSSVHITVNVLCFPFLFFIFWRIAQLKCTVF